jgi:hypothetical protein
LLEARHQVKQLNEKENKTMTTFNHDQLRQFTGDVIRFRHSLNRCVIYTPGVRFVAQEGGAYWLIDEIAILLGSDQLKNAVSQDPRIGSLHFWKLNVNEDHSAILTATADSDVAPFIVREIPLTDFPLDHIDIWAGFDGIHWTLYLPSEH